MKKKETFDTHAMGTAPVNQILLKISLPMMFSMLIQALYYIVDTIFVSRLSEAALTAVALAFPCQHLTIAVGVGTGVGINALLSRKLGEQDREGADRAVSTALFLTALHSLLFMGIGYFSAKPFIMRQTTDPEIARLGIEYLQVIFLGSFGCLFQMCWERFLQSCGRTFDSMQIQLFGTVINIVLDPLLIFGCWGFPAMGVRGAALATIIAQILASLMGWWKNRGIEDFAISFSFDRASAKEIYRVGIPSALMMAINSLTLYVMNKILMGFSSTATAVLTIYMRLESFIFMPIFGLNNGMVPLIAYNYGAKLRDRIYALLGFALKLSLTIMGVGLVLFNTMPEQLLKIFNASPEMLAIGTVALKRISLCFPFAGVSIILNGCFQGFGKGNYALFNSLFRQVIMLLPIAWLLAQSGNLDQVWYCYLISDIGAMCFNLCLYRRLKKDVIEKIPAGSVLYS